MEEEGYVNPARRESRLVMVQLEPKVTKLTINSSKEVRPRQKGSPNPEYRRLFKLKEACCGLEEPHGNLRA